MANLLRTTQQVILPTRRMTEIVLVVVLRIVTIMAPLAIIYIIIAVLVRTSQQVQANELDMPYINTTNTVFFLLY